jgi:hypothetical protein
MDTEPSLLAGAIEKHLMEKGLAQNHINLFLKDLTRAISDSNESLSIKDRLRILGWDDMDVDYRTMELAEAYLDSGTASSELH